MDQGKTSVARSLLELQPTALLEFFVIYPNHVERPDLKRYFHGGSVFNQKIKWQGQTYVPIPIEVEGFEATTNGQMPRPKIRISNKEFFMTDVLSRHDDFRHAKIIRKRTFLKYLDADNFSGGENPWGTADSSAELSSEIFTVGQKTAENRAMVEFELSSPLDVDNQDITRRILMSQYCPWLYRGQGCNWGGEPTADGDDNTLSYTGNWYGSTGDKGDEDLRWARSNPNNSSYSAEDTAYASGKWAFVENKNIIITHPKNPNNKSTLKTWYRAKKLIKEKNNFIAPNDSDNFWAKEECSKTVNGCKLRFGSDGNLPFGGFPGTNKYGS